MRGVGGAALGPGRRAVCSREKRPGVRAASRAGESRQAPRVTGSTGRGRQQTRHPRLVEPQRHQAATRRTAARGPGKRSRAPSPERLWGRVWSPGLGLPSCHSRPAGRSLQTDTSCPGAPHNPGLARNRLPWRMLGGCFCNPRPTLSSSNLLQVKKDCFPRRVGPEQSGDLMGSRAAGYTLGGCAETHNSSESGTWPQACVTGHSVRVPGEWAWVTAHSPARATNADAISPGTRHMIVCVSRDRIWSSETDHGGSQERNTCPPSTNRSRNPTQENDKSSEPQPGKYILIRILCNRKS